MKHFLSISDLSKQEIEKILSSATLVEKEWDNCRALNNKCIATFFAEPSTRTRFSFERAMHWLGGRVITAADASTSSSLTKGESLKDTFRTLEQYADAIVMRHSDEHWPDIARKHSNIPVINAGSGSGEHPTQALLDLHTIKQVRENLNNLKIMFCGDLAKGRTVHSLIELLQLYSFENKIKIYLCPAKLRHKNSSFSLSLPEKYCNKGLNLECIDLDQVDDVLPEIDVFYMTRIQKERQSCDGIVDFFRLNKDNICKVKSNAAILHPLPRNEEISEDIDDDPRAAYHDRQVRNGLCIRIALLDYLLYRGEK